MELSYKKYGEGEPLIMLHGVFGSSDNLTTVAKHIAEKGFSVYLLDARNHGDSLWAEDINYDLMASDLSEFIEKHSLKNPNLLGHSMGGKVVMNYALNFENLNKLIVVDIAPRAYSLHHEHIFEGIRSLDLSKIMNRKEADDMLSKYISDFGERQFILKNLIRKGDKFSWQLNVDSLFKHRSEIVKDINSEKPCLKPALFIKGGDSNYISKQDSEEIKHLFPNSILVTIEGANHWVHAIKPEEFENIVLDFLSTK